MALATTFGRNSFNIRAERPLTDEEIFRTAPSIFAIGAHESRSERYTYIPTIEVLNGLRREGFQPFMAVQSKSRIEGKSEFTKHMLRLRREGQITAQEAFEIILINSHDGTSSYQMMAGVFRFVCQNGMVTGDTYEDVKVPHRGNIVHNVIDAAYTIVENAEPVQESIQIMKDTTLSLPESRIFAEAALSIKYDNPDDAPISAHQLLTSRRREDRSTDLWSVFNRVQENVIRGGLHGRTANGKRTRTREITSIDNNVKLNKALWLLSEKMAALKGA